MTAILSLLKNLVALFGAFNASVLWVGRQISWVLVFGMVSVIMLQVFYRYVLNSALPWPEEAARAMMIWMMALCAPSAYRWGGFVNITLFADMLPDLMRKLLHLALHVMALIILVYLMEHALKHFNSGFIFKSSSLKIHLAWIYLAMSVCFGLLISVNIELILRVVGQLFGSEDGFENPSTPSQVAGE